MTSEGTPRVASSAELGREPGVSADVRRAIERDGPCLVVPAHGASLPMRCVMCNAPAHERVTRTLRWHPPGYYLVLSFAGPLYFIVALIVRRRARVELGLCALHVRRRRVGLWLSLLGALASMAVFIAVALTDSDAQLPYLLSTLGAIVFIAVGLRIERVVVTHRIADHRVWLRVDRRFLESF